MKIVDNIAHKLYIGVSKIPGAGVGLFTGVDILAGKPICEYKGEVFDLDDTSVNSATGGNVKGKPITLSEKTQKRLGEKYAYTMALGFDAPATLYSINWESQSPGPRSEVKGGRKMIDCQPSLTNEEMGLGGFVNDKRGYLERTGTKYEAEREFRKKPPITGTHESGLDESSSTVYAEWLKKLNKLDISLGYNSTYWSHPTEVLIYLLSIRDIKAGEELYVNYGHTYWTPFIKKVEKDKAAAEKEIRRVIDKPEGELTRADLEKAKVELKKEKKDQEQPEKTEPDSPSDSPSEATIVNTPKDLVSTASENVKDE